MTQIIQIHMNYWQNVKYLYFLLKTFFSPKDLMFLCDSLYERIQIDHQFAKMKNSFLLKIIFLLISGLLIFIINQVFI